MTDRDALTVQELPQGDVALLNHPVAQELLNSAIPARLGYVALDGTPRVTPIWFSWTGEEFVFGAAGGSSKGPSRSTPKRQFATWDPSKALSSAATPRRVLPGWLGSP